MEFKSIALTMYPYWLMGIFVIMAVFLSGHKDTIRVDKKGLLSWARILGMVTIYRIVIFKLFSHNHVLQDMVKHVTAIPWPLTLFVFWEDACHGLPLLLIQRFLGTDKWWKKAIHGVLMGTVMLEFGLGHVYQGFIAAGLLSLYIPYSIKIAKKYGFGTIMIGHTMYDLVTILSLKFLAGL